MLYVEAGALERVQVEIARRKEAYMQRLTDMRAGISCAKTALVTIKAQRKAAAPAGKKGFDSLINQQRVVIQNMEATYSNSYNGRPKPIIPVYVETHNGRVLMNWVFLQTVLSRLRGMSMEFSAGTRVLSIVYYSFNHRVKGLFELNQLDYDIDAELITWIPTAYAE